MATSFLVSCVPIIQDRTMEAISHVYQILSRDLITLTYNERIFFLNQIKKFDNVNVQ